MNNLYPQWLNLLKWSLAQSDGTSDSTAQPMSQQNREWLATVMKELVKDEASRMLEISKEFVAFLSPEYVHTDSNNINELLEELSDIVEQIDMAQIFVKYGGVKCLLMFIECPYLSESVQAQAASVIGTLAQNNPQVQDAMYETRILDQLNRICGTNLSDKIITKVLFAISSIIRSHALNEEYFCTHIANLLFTKCLQSKNVNILRRCIFLSTALINSDTSSPSRIISLGSLLIPDFFPYISSEDIDLRESSIHLLESLLKYSSGYTLLTPYLSTLTQLLEQHIIIYEMKLKSQLEEDIDMRDQVQHETSLLKQILQFLATPPPDPSSTSSSSSISSSSSSFSTTTTPSTTASTNAIMVSTSPLLSQPQHLMPLSTATTTSTTNSTASIGGVNGVGVTVVTGIIEDAVSAPILLLAPPTLTAASSAP